MYSLKTVYFRSSAIILHVCISLLIVYCLLFIPTFSLEAKSGLVESQPVVASDMSEFPLYSTLYEELLSLERKGEAVKALQVIPEIYGAEIPVDSFYITLENKRLQLLETVSQKEISFSIGKEMHTFSSVREIFRDLYLRKPESYRQMVQLAGDIEIKRFSYLMIIEGQDAESTPLTFDIKTALNKADPWITSAAIFLSRKQEAKTLTSQDIINRWQSRPDLWDEESTHQTLLFLAQFDTTVNNDLEISNEDIRLQVETLRPVSKDHGYVAPLLFYGYGEDVLYRSSFTGTIVQMKENKNRKGVVKRWVGDRNHYSSLAPVAEQRIKAWKFQDGALPVEPGLYKLRFNSVYGSPPSGFYGESAILEVDVGQIVIFPIALTPAI